MLRIQRGKYEIVPFTKKNSVHREVSFIHNQESQNVCFFSRNSQKCGSLCPLLIGFYGPSYCVLMSVRPTFCARLLLNLQSNFTSLKLFVTVNILTKFWSGKVKRKKTLWQGSKVVGGRSRVERRFAWIVAL